MASKRFNLGDYNLPGLSVSAPETEQIELIPLDRIDPDPNNFYSLEGIDELAANIETVGLLDPLRVRPVGERYTLVSGHRRRAACMLIRDGGSEMFKNGVPSIVERGEASDALRELRLLSANSATRIMSDAELSKQAERMTAVLYQLKQEGYKFPGKMRTIVAQACQVSESKLARLHAIRNKGDEYVVDAFDRGDINESVSYDLSKLPKSKQRLFMTEHLRSAARLNNVSALTVDNFCKRVDFFMRRSCPVNPNLKCSNADACLLESERRVSAFDHYAACNLGKCCSDCSYIADCLNSCAMADEIKRKAEARADETRKQQEHFEAERAEKFKRQREQDFAAMQKAARRLLPLFNKYARDPEEFGYDISIEEMEKIDAADDPEVLDEIGYSDMIPDDIETLIDASAALVCTTDFLLGLSDTPTPKSPEWQTGEPPEDGWYCCWAKWNPDAGRWDPEHAALYWHSYAWFEDETDARQGKTADYDVLGWVPVPGPMEEE